MVLTVTAVECSTYVITVAFTDDATPANPITPTTFHWKLIDSAGTVINSRTDVTVTPAASVNIVLSGNDLDLTGTGDEVRYVTVWGLYDSTYGLGLPYTDEVRFVVTNLKGL